VGMQKLVKMLAVLSFDYKNSKLSTLSLSIGEILEGATFSFFKSVLFLRLIQMFGFVLFAKVL
jgi:hypothetical protein